MTFSSRNPREAHHKCPVNGPHSFLRIVRESLLLARGFMCVPRWLTCGGDGAGLPQDVPMEGQSPTVIRAPPAESVRGLWQEGPGGSWAPSLMQPGLGGCSQ